MSEWFRDRRDPLSKIFEELEKLMAEAIPEDITRERELPDGSKVREFGPYTYGYSVRIGPDGEPEIEEFGNIRPRRPKPFDPLKPIPHMGENPPDEKEPILDIITKNNDIKVIVEMPGVEEKDIELQCIGKSLIILVNNEKRKEIELPVQVDAKNHRFSYRNGILEITLRSLSEKVQENNESKIKWL